MKLSDVITLVGAGYTRAEIDAMEAQDQLEGLSDPPAAPSQAPQQEPKPESAAAPPETAPQRDPELLEAIKALTAAVQHNNVVNSSQPAGVSPANALEDADKLLTKFCNT